MAFAYRNRQKDAAGTRRHLSKNNNNNNKKLLRKEGRGTKQHKTFPFSPSSHPRHIPDHGSQRTHPYLHLDKSRSPTFTHFSIFKSAQIAQR